MGPAHPAKFSAEVLDALARHLLSHDALVLDPFAGVGLVHSLCERSVGVELEPEWAAAHPRTLVGNATRLPFADGVFDAIATSPCYGNRMADHHEAKERCRECEGTGVRAGDVCGPCAGRGRRDYRRITYRHSLGRPLSAGSTAAVQWGLQYQLMHRLAWREARRVLKPGGLFLLNISDHVRGGRLQPVVQWHRDTLECLGFEEIGREDIETRRMRMGANSGARAASEVLFVLRLSAAARLDLFDVLDDAPRRPTVDVQTGGWL